MRRIPEWQRSDPSVAPPKNTESGPVSARRPKYIEQGGATEGDRTSPQHNDPAIPTTPESHKQRLSFHAFTTQSSPNLPAVATQEDSTDLPHPTGEIVLRELVSEKLVTDSGSHTDVVVSTAEEES